MEYVVGPVLALLLGLKFTDHRVKKAVMTMEEQRTELLSALEAKVIENNKLISQQTLKMMMPMASSVQKINGQLGL